MIVVVSASPEGRDVPFARGDLTKKRFTVPVKERHAVFATQLVLESVASIDGAPQRSRNDQHQTGVRRGTAEVLLGDAYDLLPTIPTASVDLLLTSPPYWGHRTYNREHNWDILKEWRATATRDAIPPYDWYRAHGGALGLEPLPEWYVAHLVEILDRARTCLKPKGSMWINLGDTYFARWSSIRQNGRQGLGGHPRERRRTPMGGFRQEKQLLLIPARLAIGMQERRWILRNDLIWYKPNVPPRPETDRLRLAHEHFFHFVKRPTQGRPQYFYDLAEVEPSGTDVVTHNVRPGQDGHTATFPEGVITPRILSSCPLGGRMVDPFCGTGRALAVAVQNGRDAIGFDLVPEYVETARALAKSGAAGDDAS